jgi:hypothetical protein
MDHRPFEDWLLEDKVLIPDEKRALNAHLRDCTSCTALAEVDLALKSVRVAEPATGFSDRFQIRLAARKRVIQQRNLWGFLILVACVLNLLACGAWPFVKYIAHAPVDALTAWLSSVLSFWASLQAVLNAGVVLFKVMPGFVPAYIWIVVLFAAGGWSLLWVFSLMKFTKFPRGV